MGATTRLRMSIVLLVAITGCGAEEEETSSDPPSASSRDRIMWKCKIEVVRYDTGRQPMHGERLRRASKLVDKILAVPKSKRVRTRPHDMYYDNWICADSADGKRSLKLGLRRKKYVEVWSWKYVGLGQDWERDAWFRVHDQEIIAEFASLIDEFIKREKKRRKHKGEGSD